MNIPKKLNRKRRKLNYIHVKNIISMASPILGGLFYSDDFIHGNNQWIDFFFLSKRSKNIWNVHMTTAKLRYLELIKDKVADLADVVLGKDGYERYPTFRRESDPKTKNPMWVPIEPSPIEALGGLTRKEWEEQKCKEIADSGQITVFESIKVNHSYSLGIGLQVVKDVPGINIDIINHFIIEFIKNGEKGFASIAPLTFSYTDIQSCVPYLSNRTIELWEFIQKTDFNKQL